MIVTILWEDQRGPTRGFGPHELLVQCLVDRLARKRSEIERCINGVPKKGVSNVLRAMRQDLRNLANDGPVFAVIDRDKIHRALDAQPMNCMTGMRDYILENAQGKLYVDVVFLVDNIESLIDASCVALGIEKPSAKPTLDERDRYCGRLVWKGTPATRAKALEGCPSFARLVERVAKSIG